MADKNKSWQISINTFDGYIPQWFTGSYSFIGNKNQSSDNTDIDIINTNVLTQGPKAVDLTTGTESGAVTTLIKGILRTCVTSNTSYATGGAKLYQLSLTTVNNTSPWPHSIDKASVTAELGEDVCYYQGKLYYSYNHSASAGDIGVYDLATTFDDDWGSTVPTGKEALTTGPHQMMLGGDDIMYFTNGNYIGYYDGTTDTLEPQGVDFWTNSQVVSITWNYNRIIGAINRPNIAGANFNWSGIYTWNGHNASWENDPIEVQGRMGALYTKNGVTFAWWNDGSSNIFGYIDGTKIIPLRRFDGTLPLYYQVGEINGFIFWFVDGEVMLWGAGDVDLAVNMFSYTSSTNATSGGAAAPFKTLMLASNATTHYALQKTSGYSLDARYNTLTFPVSGPEHDSFIDTITIETEALLTGAKLDTTLYKNFGTTNTALTQIAYDATNKTKTRWKILNRSSEVQNFQLNFSWANGSITNDVKVRSIFIQGHNVIKN